MPKSIEQMQQEIAAATPHAGKKESKKKFLKQSKVKDVLYRGGHGYKEMPEGFLKGEARPNYATFASTSPHVASSYAGQGGQWAHPDEVGAVVPMHIKAHTLHEFPVPPDRYGRPNFDMFEFDRQARGLGPGHALVARKVYDGGPRASKITDPEMLYSYPSDIYAWNTGTEVKSALSKASGGLAHMADGGQPFYSPVDQAISKLSQAKGTGDQYLSMIRNTHGVKPQEIEDRGLEQKMTGKMSIPDVQRIASENPMPKITESTAHQSDFYYAGKGADGKYYLHTDSGKPIAGPYDMAHDAESNIEKFQANKPQYAKYQLPGGQNYREIKLRIPTKGKDKFKSKHFEEPNVLAHARVSDRTGPNGEKILHVEEIQSDWHQTARDLRNEEIDRLVGRGMPIEEAKKYVPANFGYRGNIRELPSGYQVQEFNSPSGSKEYRVFSPKGNLYASGLSSESATKNAIDNLNGGNKVPDAPHKKDWHELVLKHLLNHAAKNGYDKMIITPGEEQAKRYDLNKHIGQIDYKHNPNKTVSLLATDKNNGLTAIHEEDLPYHNIHKHVGKEMAQRIMAGEGTPRAYADISDGKMQIGDLDLKVGDEGMKGFYNDIVPSFLNKYGKKWGAKVGQYNLSVHPHQADNQYAVHSFDIPPQMREEIVNKGQSRYAKGGSVKPIPAEAGSTPVKEGHVRLYHQTDGDNLRKIEKEGLLLKHAKGIEGPRAIYAGETPFYGSAKSRPTLEFQVPKEHWQSPFVLHDVAPKDIIAAHYPWHSHARYLESEDNKEAKENELSGKHDNLGGDTGKAVQYIKEKYGVKKAKGGDVSVSDMRRALMAKGGDVKEPKSTVPAYKLFRMDKKQPGKLFPLFVDAKTPVEKDEWVKAKAGEMAGEKVKSKIGPLAYRPGWHAGDLPIATHIGEKSDSKLNKPDRRPHNQVWAEIDMANDVDWQKKANERGMNKSGKLIAKNAHITDQVPKGGHYRYKTNPNMTGSWLIGGEMKVKRVLPDAEVQKINKKAKVKDLPREKPLNLKEWGFKNGGSMSLLQSKD